MASAASIDNWSDSEIRTKLAELGTPVGPVTETTRKILIKKLKRLLQLQNNNASSPSKQRRSLVRYSSGEDSQGEGADMPPPTTKVKNLRRKTIGPSELSASSNSSADISRSGISERTTRGRKSLASIPISKVDSLDTDSDSDLSQTFSSSRLRKPRKSDIPDRSSPKPRESLQDVKNEYTTSWSSYKRTTEFIRPGSRVPELQKSMREEEELEDTEEEEEEEEEEEVNEKEVEKKPVFQSNFLSRLSSAGKLPSSYRSSVSPKLESKPSPSSYIPSYITQRSPRPADDKIFSSRPDYKSLYGTKSSESGISGGYTSLLNQRQSMSYGNVASKARINSFFAHYKNSIKLSLVCVAGVALISILYFLLVANFNTRIYLAAIDSDNNKYPICGKDGVDPQMCVQDEHFKSALDVSKVFIPRVLELTTKAYCDSSFGGDPTETPTLSDDDALNYLSTKMPKVSRPQLEKSLRNFKILVLSNPHWEIEIVSKGLPDLESILFNGDFAARRVDLPIGCYLRLMGYKLLKLAILIAILAGTGFGILFGTKLYKKRQENHKQDVYSMINKILNLLSAHHEQNVLPAYLAVNNCRDELIPPSERDKKRRVWDDAVEFLEKNESRVRTEVHSIRGENVKVWRWLPAGGPPVSPNATHDSSTGPILGRLL